MLTAPDLDSRATPPDALLTCVSSRWPHIFTSFDDAHLAAETAAYWCGNCSAGRVAA